jgi:hypothetical protein
MFIRTSKRYRALLLLGLRPGLRLLLLVALLGVSACASFKPVPLEELTFRERAEGEGKNGLRVAVSVLNREESRQAFGVNLEKRGIQPVWVEIENRTDKSFWFMMSGLDPNYFSAHEAAYMNHYFMGGSTNARMDAYFSDLGIEQLVGPGKTESGFVFANETVGTKEVRVRLYGQQDVRDFHFFVSIPGVVSEWDEKDLDLIASQTEKNIEDEAELAEILRDLPCCTQRENGTGEGDPLNLVMIGDGRIIKAFVTAGWDEAIFQQDFRSMFGAAYLYGRPPDVQFQKARRRVDSVTRVQLWITPYRYHGEPVIVGSVGRNIDPDVDEAAQYLAEDLASAGLIATYGRVPGVGFVSRDAPRRNFANAPYWTRGDRSVLLLSQELVEFAEIARFPWEWERAIRVQDDD